MRYRNSSSIKGFVFGVLLLLTTGIGTFAQSFKFKGHEKSEKHTARQIQLHRLPDTIIVRGDSWYDVRSGSAWRANMKIKSVQDYVRFYIDHSYLKRTPFPYSFRICFNVTGYRDSTTAVNFPADTLTMSYKPDSLGIYQDLTLRKYSNFHKLRVIITAVLGDPAGVVNVDTMTALNWVVEGSVVTQRYDKKYGSDTYYGKSGAPDIYSLMYTNFSTNFAEVFFNVSGPGVYVPVPIEPASFELEWTYVDNYKRDIVTGNVTTKSVSELSYDFRNNATRVWLDTNYFRIPLVYQRGYLVYRIRMVRPDSNNYQYPIYGNWSLPDSNSLSSATGKYADISNSHRNDSLNWQYTVSFAESGKYKHVLSYFDGLLKNRQSITRFNSEPGRLIATEQVYDFEGRPSISVLPTPVPSPSFTYQQGLSLNSATGLPYKAADFDTMAWYTCPGVRPPSPLHSAALANIYYSSANPDKSGYQKFVPSAGGYPFVQTIYSTGFDDRIERQGGAGDSLQIGFGHDTKYDYAAPEQQDLNRMFGVDAGWSGYYRKIVTTDPNGQLSVAVQDYKGRPVSSSLIGRGPNPEKLAIVSNSNVPDSGFRVDELIASTTQSVVGNTKTLVKDFYMDVAGYDSIQYVFDFQPMQVCLPSDSAYLSIAAHYKYEVFDQCGNLDLSDEDTIGITGVMKYAAPVSSAGAKRGIYLSQGTHTIRKELTVNPDDVYAAVDTLMMHPPGCIKDEPYFIKDAVLKENFPCPTELTECELIKRRLKEELWPGKKYGQYHSISSTEVDGGDNSIFTRYCENDTTFTVVTGPLQPGHPDTITKGSVLYFYTVKQNCKYRYQMCTNLRPESVSDGVGGVTMVDMNTTPVRNFIANFNDATADSLLPLHPEYCKYKNCFDDTYPGEINSIPDAVTAEANHRFALDSIIAHDPILPRLTSGPVYFAHARDSLALYRGGKTGIDTMAIMKAYCDCSDSLMNDDCMNSSFRSKITTLSFMDPLVKENYFPRMRDAYFSNRERFKAYLSASADSTCEPCRIYRMRTIPDPVFPDIFNADGSYSETSTFTKGTLKGSDSTTGIPIKKLKELEGVTAMDSFLHLRDSVTLVSDSVMKVLTTAKIKSVIDAFANCTPTAKLPALADTLLAMSEREGVDYGDFTPAQIRYAMDVNGIALTDLCNPYMVSYDYHAPESLPAGIGCRSDEFYNDMLAFMNKMPVQALADANVSGMSGFFPQMISTANPFESKLYDELGYLNLKVMAKRNSDTSVFTVYVMPDVTSPADTVKISFSLPEESGSVCRNILSHSATPATDTFDFKKLICISEDFHGSLGTGFILNMAFQATLEKKMAGGKQTCDVIGWNDKIKTTSAGGDLQECIPCTQMLSLYKQFNDTMNAYGVKGIDHPFHPTMLVNFLNEKLHKIYSWAQYIRFIESCAIADSLPFYRYNGYANVNFATDAAANSFLSYINTLDTVHLEPLFRYKDDSVRIMLDFNALPRNKMRIVRDHITAYMASARVNTRFNPPASTQFVGWLLVYNGTPFDSSLLRSEVWGKFDIAPARNIDVWSGISYIPYQRYEISVHSGASNAMVSSGVDQVNKFISYHEMAAYFMNMREETVDSEYYLFDKQEYLRYVYKFAARKPHFVLDTIKAYYLDMNVFPGRTPQYGSASAIPDLQNLYLSAPGDPGLTKARYILSKAKTHFGGSYITPEYPEFVAGKITISGVVPPERLELFYCGDKTYWYRYFGVGDTMFNIFFKLPEYIPETMKNDYVYQSCIANVGPAGVSRSIKMKLSKGSDTFFVNAFADFVVGKSETLHDVLMANAFGEAADVLDTIENCERVKLNSAVRLGRATYTLYIDSVRNSLRTVFNDYVMSHLGERLYLGFWDQRHGTTLYYYDRAGNLNRTVSPGGVAPILSKDTLAVVDKRRADNVITKGVIPAHKKISVYEYNTLDKVVRQSTPDGGEVGYIYDDLGRVIYSQNAKQALSDAFTYTMYDGQGRVTETGEVDLRCGVWGYLSKPGGGVDSIWTPCIYMWYPGTGSGPTAIPPYYSKLNPYVYNALNYTQKDREAYIRTRKRSDVVYTVYDTAAKDLSVLDGINAQENLRKRVSCIKYFEQLPVTDTFYQNYTYASHYSYDIAGNVKTLVHDYPYLDFEKQRYKTVDYDYDLASGKINMLSYNRGWGDQFYHRYSYDDDNRITITETSADGVVWKRDAAYQYYQHGPLARVSVGDLRVQGIDFAYTIQGWLKAVNGDVLKPQYEMGMDSFGNNMHAYDAAATAINYFKGDYKPIGTTAVMHTAEPATSLYNGNISRLSSDLLPFKPLMANFTYDQLNRIKYAVYDTMSPVVAGISTLSPIQEYKNSYDYDADGNITRLIRRGNLAGADRIMDSMRYYYMYAGTNNRLTGLTDSAENRYLDDVDKYTKPSAIRYAYDAIGNVIRDDVSNQDTIRWNLYNKVTYTHNISAKSKLRFTYDGAGHRVAKYHTLYGDNGPISETNEFFVHDAQGNILAVYKHAKDYVYEPISFKVINVTAMASAFVSSTIGMPAYLSELVTPTFAMMPGFEDALKPYMISYESGLPQKSAAYYLAIDTTLTDLLVGTPPDWSDSLRDYSAAMSNEHYVSSACASVYMSSDMLTGSSVLNYFLSPQDTGVRFDVLNTLGNALPPPAASDFFMQVNNKLNLQFTPMMTTEELCRNIIQNQPNSDLISAAVAQQMIESNGNLDFVPFFDVLLSPANANAPAVATATQTVLSNYGDRTFLRGFFGAWSQSYGRLDALKGPGGLYLMEYHTNPAAYLTSMDSALGSAFLDTTIAMIEGMTPEIYFDKVDKGVSSPSLTLLTAADWTSTKYSLISVQVLVNDDFNLTEHHLYGSSRLGIKNYLTGQVRAYSMIRSGSGSEAFFTRDTGSLVRRSAWYSAKLSELIASNQKLDYGHIDSAKLTMWHVLGLKQYEVTNHLGNVLSTVSDNRYEKGIMTMTQNGPVLGDSVKVYAPAVPTSYDYYPFGQLMPGRYQAADTTTQYVNVVRATGTLSGPGIGSSPMSLALAAPVAPGGGTGHADLSVSSNQFELYTDTLGAGMVVPLNVTVGEPQDITLNIGMVLGEAVRASVVQTYTNLQSQTQEAELCNAVITMEGQYILSFVPSDTQVRLQIMYYGGQDAGVAPILPDTSGGAPYAPASILSGSKVAGGIDATSKPATAAWAYIKVVKNPKDLYRFGFNGKEKVNEVFGRGTHYDYGARYYDARVAKWFSTDPLTSKYPYISPYSFANNSPVLFKDFDGNDFGVKMNNTDHTIIIVSNIYTTSKKGYEQVSKAAAQWNSKKTVVDGYTVTFQIKVHEPYETTKEEVIKGEPLGLYKKNGKINNRVMDESLYGVSVYKALTKSDGDKIGNIYYGNRGGNARIVTGETFEGGVTENGKSISMHTHKNEEFGMSGLGDMGEDTRSVTHELGHTLGLDDKGKGDYYSPGGIMQYFTNNPVSDDDVKDVVRYANDAIKGKTNTNGAKVTILENTGVDNGSNPITK